MQALREHVAVAIDGGGIRGVMVSRALSILEDKLGKPAYEIFELAAGTSTGSIISAGIAARRSGEEMFRLYKTLGNEVFRPSWRSALWPLTAYRYPHDPLESAIRTHIGTMTMGELWANDKPVDIVITAFDVVTNHTCFIKPWKTEYTSWPVSRAVLASCSVPTYFPPVEGRFVDGGVGAYANPCYLAAYELWRVLQWDPAETTLISLGTGREPHTLLPGQADGFRAWHWLSPILSAFQQSADDQQIHLVRTYFDKLDFRRFQVDLREPIAMDDPSQIPALAAYGDELGRKLLNNEQDQTIEFTVPRPPQSARGLTLEAGRNR